MEFGKEYPELCNLAKASPILRDNTVLHRVAIAAATMAERMKIASKRWNPGLFCSELVATLYLSLRDNVDSTINLLNEPRAPFQISPSDLSDPSLTNLREVKDVIVEQRDRPNIDLPINWIMALYFFEDKRAEKRDVSMVKLGIRVAQTKEFIQNLEDSIERWSKELSNEITVDLPSFNTDDEETQGPRSIANAQVEQQVINALWSGFDQMAVYERWDPNDIRIELAKTRSAYYDLIEARLKEDLGHSLREKVDHS